MALENLEPATRVEEILNGDNIEPATRLEYFLSAAANEVPKPEGISDAGKIPAVNSDGDGYDLETGMLLPVPRGAGDANTFPKVNALGTDYELEVGKLVNGVFLPEDILQGVTTFLTGLAGSAVSAGVGVPVYDQSAETATTATDEQVDAFILYTSPNRAKTLCSVGEAGNVPALVVSGDGATYGQLTWIDPLYSYSGVILSYSVSVVLLKGESELQTVNRYYVQAVVTALHIPTP